MAYSESPVRNSVREMVTSAMSMGSLPEELSMVSETSARPRAGRVGRAREDDVVHLAERSARGPWAPSTQVTASTTLDLPVPLGPTTAVTPGLELRDGGVGEGLEALHVERLKKHRGDATNPQPDTDAPGPRRVRSDLAVLAEEGRAARRS